MVMVITRTPFRISFFGGGTDYTAWSSIHGGAVLATAIDKYCYISCRRLPPFFDHKHRIVYSRIENVQTINDIRHPAVRAVLAWAKVEEGLEIHHDGDLPARSGLGSSSSFTVGLTHALSALRGQLTTKEKLAKDAIYIEQDLIGENVGSQDQVSAAFGGFNRIDFKRDGSFDVFPVTLPLSRLKQLRSFLMLFFTGVSRIASEVAKSKIENLKSRERELHAIKDMVDEGLTILYDENKSLESFGRLMHEGWLLKRALSDKVSNPEVDALYESAREAGAIGGKLLGAGGGGFLLIFAHPEHQPQIRDRLKDLIYVPFDYDNSGSRVVVYQPNGL
jgi:D-glycero-alpha-D-manno-heptose-7-phosphate kinase